MSETLRLSIGMFVNTSTLNRCLPSLFLLLAAIGGAVVGFRGAYEQIGNTVALWADTGIDRAVGTGFSIPMTWFQSLNPLLVFALTPFLLAHWSRLAGRGREPLPLSKMALGAAGVALSYLMIPCVAASTKGAPAAWLWLAAFFLLLTAAELYILPVGLGQFARLAPAGMAATLVAAWFLVKWRKPGDSFGATGANAQDHPLGRQLVRR